MYFTDDDGYQNFLAFPPMLISLKLDSNRNVTDWISTGIWSEKIKPFDTGLEPTMSNLTNGRVDLTFNNSVLVQKSVSLLYSNFILNLYIVYELNTRPCILRNNFTLKNYLFGTVKLVTDAIKSKCTYNRQGIASDGEGSWSFGNDFARNALIFGVDNSSSSHADNRKNNFLVLGEGLTQGIIDSTGSAGKKFGINFSKANTKSCLSLHYSGDGSYLYVNKTEIFKFKPKDNLRWYNFCLGSVS